MPSLSCTKTVVDATVHRCALPPAFEPATLPAAVDVYAEAAPPPVGFTLLPAIFNCIILNAGVATTTKKGVGFMCRAIGAHATGFIIIAFGITKGSSPW